jgi:hypothetical protein
MNADVAVTDPRVRPITHPPDQSISVHPRSSVAKISCLRRWLRVCGASRGFADLSGFMEAMCWLWVGIGKSARLTVQGINTEWFERCGRAGFCRRLTVQGINTGWFEWRGWGGLCRRLTVQRISTEWFERRGCGGFWCWLTVQGISTEWFERRDWAGRRGALRRADGGGARSGGAGAGGGRGLPGRRGRQEYFAADERR